MKKIKVLHIGMGPNKGGLESFTINMQRRINNNLIQFDYTNTFDKPLAYEDERVNLGSQVFNICARKKNPLKFSKELKNIIISGDYDYVHFHCMHYCLFNPILITCKYSKAKMIVHSHLTGFNKNSSKKEILLDKLGRFLTRKCNFYKLACGEKAGKWLFDNAKFDIIPNGIDFEIFQFNEEKRKMIREKYNISNTDILIGHVGNYSYQKNYPKLINIFKTLKKIDSNYKLLLVGDDRKESAKTIKQMVKKYNLSDSVIFTGIVDNNMNIYSGCDLYIFPSFYEGLNISLVEAQCSGLICFASNKLDPNTNVGGKYYVIDIEKSDDILARQINDVFKNLNYKRQSVAIDNNYSIGKAAKKLEEFYLSNIKNRDDNL